MNSTAPHLLRALVSPKGVACILALDHRDAMRNVYVRAGLAEPAEESMLETKGRIAEALAGRASAIMLDPAALERWHPSEIGAVVPLEEQGHEPLAGGRLNRLTEDFGPADAAALGANACKLLLYYRADHHQTAALQRHLLRETAASCKQHGLSLMVEPLVYRLDGENEIAYKLGFADLVVSAARDLTDSGAQLLKVQYPGDAASCERVTDAATPLDWTLLGGSEVSGLKFADQLTTACRAGASGFVAGRAIWGPAIGLGDDEQREWLRREAVPAFDRLSDIAHEHARSIR